MIQNDENSKEDMKNYLMEGVNQEESKIIKNGEVFRPNYVPDKLLYRKNELKELGSYLTDFFNRGVNPEKDMSIIGESGTGKTAMIRFAQETFEEECDIETAYMIYINCKSKSTAFQIFSKIARTMGDGIPKTGYGADDYFEMIQEKVQSNANIVVVLDEIDFLYKKGGLEEFDEVLYNLGDEDNISCIFVSNEPGWKNALEDVRTSRRIGSSVLRVHSYNKDQLKDIMSERKNKGLEEGVLNSENFEYMVDLVGEEYSDARKAIDLLYESAQEAEKKRASEILKYHIEKAYEKIESSGKTDFMKKFAVQKKLTFTAIQTLKSRGNDDITIDDIYKEYRRIVDIINKVKDWVGQGNSKDYRKSGKNSIYRRINEFENYGLVEKHESEIEAGRGRKKDRIEPKIDHKVYFRRLDGVNFKIDSNISEVSDLEPNFLNVLKEEELLELEG